MVSLHIIVFWSLAVVCGANSSPKRLIEGAVLRGGHHEHHKELLLNSRHDSSYSALVLAKAESFRSNGPLVALADIDEWWSVADPSVWNWIGIFFATSLIMGWLFGYLYNVLLHNPVVAGKPDGSEVGELKHFVMTGWYGMLPIWTLPATVGFFTLSVVHGLCFVDPSMTPFTRTMWTGLFAYALTDYLLFGVLGVAKYFLLKHVGLTHNDVMLLAGPKVDIDKDDLLSRGGKYLYIADSWSRKIPHMLHWAGLSIFTLTSATTPWERFQFALTARNINLFQRLLTNTCTWEPLLVWMWLPVVRCSDGYARRMNKIWTTPFSVLGFGLCAPAAAYYLSHDSASYVAVFYCCTLPCAFGDCMAEIVGVMGVLRFKVTGCGEENTKSVEGMLAMFFTSLFAISPWNEFIGGWTGLAIVSFLATIGETWAPRCTDNFFIPLFSGLGCYIAMALLLPA